MLELIFSAEGLAALVALTAMEIMLGIDNVVFIAVLVSRLPLAQRAKARRIGLILALILRVAMLALLTTLLTLTQPLFTAFGHAFSWRDLILLGGGVFLIVKATHELLIEVEGGAHLPDPPISPGRLHSAILQIAVINLVFSIDSTVTAIGMARDFSIMAIAVAMSMLVMYLAAGWVSAFIHRHPGTKILALSFLLLVGVALTAEGIGKPIDRSVIYVAMAFTFLVAALSIRGASTPRKRRPHPPVEGPPSDTARS